MLSERLFEDILVKFPELIEDRLKFLGRQVTHFGKRIDILFEDRFKEKLIIELKKDNLDRNALSQVMEYEGYILSEKDPTTRVMIIANRIPLNLKKAMDHHGIEYKEITHNYLMEFLEKRDNLLLNEILDQTTRDKKKDQSVFSEKTIEPENNLDSLPIQNSKVEKKSSKRKSSGADEFIIIVRDKLLEEDHNNWDISRSEGCLHAKHLPTIKRIENEYGRGLIAQIWMERLKEGIGRCKFEVAYSIRDMDILESVSKRNKIADSLRSFMTLHGLPKEIEEATGSTVIAIKVNWSKHQTEKHNNGEVLKIIDFYKFLDYRLIEWNKNGLIN